MYRFVITALPQGRELYVDLITSAAGRYLSRQPYVLGLIKELATNSEFKNPVITVEKDMGRVIGNSDIVETTLKDTIYYAKANKRNVYSRYAKGRYPAPSSKLTVIMVRDADSNYELTDTWIGPHCPPFPGDDNETTKSKPYWLTHALVQDAQIVQSKTITKECPY